MIYVISDIHGCYDEYMELLEKIRFSDEDELYVLGDVVDRGPEPIKVLQDMMLRPNVYPVIGNHDYVALRILQKLNVEIQEENVDNYLSEKDMLDYFYWIKDGGKTTAEKFQKLSPDEKEEILEYIKEFSLYEEVYLNEKKYILAHADIHGYEDWKSFEDYALADFIFYRADYQKRYSSDENTVIVTGHTPTFLIREDRLPLIYNENGHLAIDCGCVYGERLAAYCLDNGKTEYVIRKK